MKEFKSLTESHAREIESFEAGLFGTFEARSTDNYCTVYSTAIELELSDGYDGGSAVLKPN